MIVPGDANNAGFRILASGVRIQGFEVSGFVGGDYSCGIAVGYPAGPLPTPPSGVIIIANVVHDNYGGICFFSAGGNEARDNTAERNVSGITDAGFGPVVVSNLVIGNHLRRNSSIGLHAVGNVATRVDMNEVSENNYGIVLLDVGGGLISRNTILKNAANGIDVWDSCCFKIDHNTVRENAGWGIVVVNASDCSVDENSAARNGEGIGVDKISACQLYRNAVQQNLSIGISAFNLGTGDVFLFNTASGNGGLDCRWDGSDTPTFTANRCLTETPAGAWD